MTISAPRFRYTSAKQLMFEVVYDEGHLYNEIDINLAILSILRKAPRRALYQRGRRGPAVPVGWLEPVRSGVLYRNGALIHVHARVVCRVVVRPFLA
jgi:hypothetical protein